MKIKYTKFTKGSDRMKTKNYLKEKQISYDEYLTIIDRLDYIKNEEESLQNFKEIGWNFPSSFDELVLHLKRMNESIDLDIQLAKKKFLQELNLHGEMYHKIDMKLNLFIEQTILAYQNDALSIQTDMELLSVFSHYSSFSKFSSDIHDLASKRQANQYLLNYILEMMNEKNQLIGQKNRFEKKIKKEQKTKKRKKI